ncbi:MAG: TolB family protein, partial [Anaerolineales bacterium]
VTPAYPILAPSATAIAFPLSSPTPPPTITPSPSPIPTVYIPPVIGGADAAALVASNEIWLISLDGKEVKQLTRDRAAKRNLEWLPDRLHLLYLTGKCINILNVESGESRSLLCLEGATVLEAVRPSPDGKWLTITLDRELYIVPLDLDALSKVRTRMDLRALIERQGCLFYNEVAVKDVRWPRVGYKLALQILGVSGTRQVDAIVLYDFRNCTAGMPFKLDEFPAARFSMSGYGDRPVIPSYD